MVRNKTLENEQIRCYNSGYSDGKEQGKREVITQLLEQSSIVFDDKMGYGSARKIPVTKGCNVSMKQAIDQLESYSDTAPTESVSNENR